MVDKEVREALVELVDFLTMERCHHPECSYAIYSVGTKLAKISYTSYGQCSVHCFVAIADFQNKALGSVQQGQIFKPASWSAPARHSRGDLFDKSTWPTTFTEFGVRYLR